MNHTRRLLKEYVKFLVSEDVGMEGSYGYGGMITFGSSDEIFKIFTGPIKDALMVGVAETKKMLPLAKLAARTVAGALTSLIPGISANWKKTFSDYNAEVKQIQTEFEPYYKNLELGNDAHAIAFLWNPGLYLIGTAVSKTSKAIDNFSSKVKLENKIILIEDTGSAKLASDLSKKYRQDLNQTLQDIITEIETISKMPEDEFIKEYAQLLGDKQRFIKEIDNSVQKIKKKKQENEVSQNNQVTQKSSKEAEAALQMMEKNKSNVILNTKKQYADTYVQMLDSEIKKTEAAIKEMNKKSGKNVSSKQHGLIPLLQTAVEKIKAIKIS